MPGRLIIDGNAVYEIDEDCLKRRRKTWGKLYGAEDQRRSEEGAGEALRRTPGPEE